MMQKIETECEHHLTTLKQIKCQFVGDHSKASTQIKHDSLEA